jgi:hypothetical protein
MRESELVSHKTFERFCVLRGFRAEPIQRAATPTPDYKVWIGAKCYIVELKQLDPNEEDERQRRELETIGETAGELTPGKRAHSKVGRASVNSHRGQSVVSRPCSSFSITRGDIHSGFISIPTPSRPRCMGASRVANQRSAQWGFSFPTISMTLARHTSSSITTIPPISPWTPNASRELLSTNIAGKIGALSTRSRASLKHSLGFSHVEVAIRSTSLATPRCSAGR